ncbi:MAG: MBL fold metallo-hydrolase [Clostridia bacterium]|nr:MBL fold metallo-hydrolase [Clostridia bacterium]
MDLSFKIMTSNIKQNEIGIFWLGQAGFLIKDPDHNIIAVDPYLTDCGERIRGFKRLSPKLISPGDLEPDIYITTHTHFDHFDYDAIPIVSASPKTNFFGPKSCVEEYLKLGISKNRIFHLELGKEVVKNNVLLKAVHADHGEMAPDAIGLFINISNIKIYFTGDTAYSPEEMKEIVDLEPDIIVASINGVFGNLDPENGAKLVRDVKAKVAIPCHFWTFKEHYGNPQLFEDNVKKFAPNCMVKFMFPGEMYRYP